jgi:hypothetical protein
VTPSGSSPREAATPSPRSSRSPTPRQTRDARWRREMLRCDDPLGDWVASKQEGSSSPTSRETVDVNREQGRRPSVLCGGDQCGAHGPRQGGRHRRRRRAPTCARRGGPPGHRGRQGVHSHEAPSLPHQSGQHRRIWSPKRTRWWHATGEHRATFSALGWRRQIGIAPIPAPTLLARTLPYHVGKRLPTARGCHPPFTG